MTGRHAADPAAPRHDAWRPPVPPRPVWPLAVVGTGRHRLVRGETLAALARPGEVTARLLRASRKES